MIASDMLAALRAALGAEQVLTGTDAAPYLTDWRRAVTGRVLCVSARQRL